MNIIAKTLDDMKNKLLIQSAANPTVRAEDIQYLGFAVTEIDRLETELKLAQQALINISAPLKKWGGAAVQGKHANLIEAFGYLEEIIIAASKHGETIIQARRNQGQL